MKVMLFLFSLSFSSFAMAQFNDSTHYYTGLISTGIMNRTEKGTSYLFTNTLKAGISKKKASLNSSNSWTYGWQQHNLTNNDFSSTLDFNVISSVPHLYYWGLGAYDKSYSLKINNRLQAGLGAAYNLVERKYAALNISNGVLYENSDLMVSADQRDKYHTLRNSFRLRYRLSYKDIVVLAGTNFLQNSLSRAEDYIIRANNSLSVKVVKWLSFTSTADFNVVNRTHSQNLLLTYGLTLEKYF